MRTTRNLTIVAAGAAFLALAGTAWAVSVQTSAFMSVRAGVHEVGGTDFDIGDIVVYTWQDSDITHGTSSLYLKATNYFVTSGGSPVASGHVENIDALDILPNYFGAGNDGILVSTAGQSFLRKQSGGILTVNPGDIALVNRDTKTATIYLPGHNGASVFRTSGGSRTAANTDAFSFIGQDAANNDLVLISTTATAYLGANRLRIRQGDVALYNVGTDTATLYFSQDLFLQSNGCPGAGANVDGVAIVTNDGSLLLSTEDTELLHTYDAATHTAGMLTVLDADIVRYDFGPDGYAAGVAGIGNDNASIFFPESLIHCTNSPDLDAFDVLQIQEKQAVPEPLTLVGVLVGAGLFGRRLPWRRLILQRS